jgi:Leucine-rich repeat (LRR) protein
MFDVAEEEEQQERSLNITNLSLSLLPDLGGLSPHILLRITQLNLSRNNLTSLAGISVLGHLRVLNASDNKIVALPIDELAVLRELTTLNLHGNDIGEVPFYLYWSHILLRRTLSFRLILDDASLFKISIYQ